MIVDFVAGSMRVESARPSVLGDVNSRRLGSGRFLLFLTFTQIRVLGRELTFSTYDIKHICLDSALE